MSVELFIDSMSGRPKKLYNRDERELTEEPQLKKFLAMFNTGREVKISKRTFKSYYIPFYT